MVFILDLLSYYDVICSIVCFLLVLWGCWSKARSLFRRQPYSIINNLSIILDWFYEQKTISIVLLSIGIVSTIISNSAVRQWLGIHDLELENGGVYCYYMQIERGNTAYTLPAKIEIVTEKVYRPINPEKDDVDYVRYYYATEAYFTNGSTLYFEGDSQLSVNRPSILVDSSGRKWKCTLLNHHAYSPQVEETSHVRWATVLSLCISTLSIFTVLLAFVRMKDPLEKYHTNDPPSDNANVEYVPRKIIK